MPAKPAPYRRKQYRRTFIRQWRVFRGLTLEQLAARVEMTPSALSLLERGQSAYTQPTLERLADALSTTPASLLMRDPSKSDASWGLEDQLAKATGDQQRQILAVVETMLKTGTSN